MDFKKHLQCELGEYAESRGDYAVTNGMTPRTHEAIALVTSGNLQETHKVFCLETGLVLNQRVNTVVPMPYLVINKMNQWGERTKREEYGGKLTFLNRTKEKYDYDNNEIQEEEGLLQEKDGPLTELYTELPGI